MAEERSGLLALPEEILLHVVEFLPLYDMYTLLYVCRFFSRRSSSPWLKSALSGFLSTIGTNGAADLCNIDSKLLEVRLVDIVAFSRLIATLQLEAGRETASANPTTQSCLSVSLNHKDPAQTLFILIKNVSQELRLNARSFTDDFDDKENQSITRKVICPRKKARYSPDLLHEKMWQDPYTSSMQNIEYIDNQLENSSKSTSWLKLSLLHKSYVSTISKIISEQKSKHKRPIRTKISSGCSDFDIAFGNKSANLSKLHQIALQGHAFAQNDLAITWINFQSKPVNIQNLAFNWGVYWFKQASVRGLGLAKYCLATCLSFPYDQKARPAIGAVSVSKNIFLRIYTLYKEAACLGVPEAQTNVGMIFYGDFPGNANNQFVRKDLSKAERWWRKAVESNQPDALLNLGLLLRKTGQRSEGFGFLLKAARFDSDRACYLVAKSYEEGDGVVRNLHEALQWYNQAFAKANSPEEKLHLMQAIQSLSARNETRLSWF